MPSEEPEVQPTETDITIEQAIEETYTSDDTGNITAEDPKNTINTSETYASPDTIYNIITGEEENIEPPADIPQINLTTTSDETVAYTETNQTLPDIPKYTETFTAPDMKDTWIIEQQLQPYAATVGGIPPHDSSDGISLDETYKSIMGKHKNPEISLQEFIEILYEIADKTKEKTAYIAPAEIAIEKYIKEHGTVINRYNTNFEQLLDECKVYSAEAQAYINFFEDIGLIEDTGEFTKIIDEKYLELMEHIYAIPNDAKEYLNILNECIQERGIETKNTDNMILNYLELNEIPKTPHLVEPQTLVKYPISPIKAFS